MPFGKSAGRESGSVSGEPPAKRVGFAGTIVIDPETGKSKLVGVADPTIPGVLEQHAREQAERMGKST